MYRSKSLKTRYAVSRAPRRWGRAIQTLSKTVRDIKQGTERKHFDVQLVATQAESGYAGFRLADMTRITRGDGPNERDGNVIKAKSVTGRVLFDGVTASATYRLIIVRDKQQVADTPPVLSNIVLTGDAFAPMSLYRLDSLGRFKVIYDKTWTSVIGTNTENRAIKFYKKLNFPVRYNGGANTDIQKNGIYIFVYSDQEALGPLVSGYARLTFTDS